MIEHLDHLNVSTALEWVMDPGRNTYKANQASFAPPPSIETPGSAPVSHISYESSSDRLTSF